MDITLRTIAERLNLEREVYKNIHYYNIYPRHFKRYVGTDVHVLELGVYKGGSLQLWRDYFGPKAKIVGVDINEASREVEDDQITVITGDVSDLEVLADLRARFPRVDILIDDCSHDMTQQIQSFKELYPHVASDGIYVCEDTYTSYWPEYGAGKVEEGSFIDFTKHLIDELNVTTNRFTGEADTPTGTYGLTMDSVHYYPGIFIVEKRKRVLEDVLKVLK